MNKSAFHQLSNEELTRLKEIELDILKHTISVIEKLGLAYYAVGGTALGAIKYSGFIPWDDDIDIAMPRQDYLVFVKEAEKHLPKHLSVQSLYTDKNYTLGVTKIRNENTTFFDAYTAQYDVSHGIFIDIFPIDDCGTTDPQSKLLYKMRENKIAWSNYYKPEDASLKQKIKALFCKIFLLFESPHSCALKNDKYLTKLNEKNNSDEVFMRIEKHDKKFFTGKRKANFCNLLIVVPNDVETYLKRCYGDISLEPPVDKRYPHHFVLHIDFDNSYKHYKFQKGEVVFDK